MHIIPTYDRSDLIHRAIAVLREKLVEESVIVSLVAVVFLFHLRSALVAILILPVAVLLAFIPMAYLKITSNIMSLGGIAIAIGAMVDAAIVMVENAHKRLEQAPNAARTEDRDHHRGGQRSRPSLVLLVAGDRRVLPADLRAGSAGGAAVHAAGLYQDVCHALCHRAVGDLGSCIDGPSHPGAHPSGNQESLEPAADPDVSTHSLGRATRPVADASGWRWWPWDSRCRSFPAWARSSCRR